MVYLGENPQEHSTYTCLFVSSEFFMFEKKTVHMYQVRSI